MDGGFFKQMPVFGLICLVCNEQLRLETGGSRINYNSSLGGFQGGENGG